MVIMLICIFAFANSFYLIGLNQVEFDNVEEEDFPMYATFIGSFQHVYLLALGEFDVEYYEAGDGNYTIILWIMFVLASFLLLIHLLNMLIAIMGETFAANNETKKMQQLKSHLRFVMDNWWIDPIKDKHKIKYLITAFLKEDDDDSSS